MFETNIMKGREFLDAALEATRRHDFTLSFHLLRLSVNHFEESWYRKGICDASALYAALYLEKGNLPECLDWCDKTEALATELKYNEVLVRIKKLRKDVEGA